MIRKAGFLTLVFIIFLLAAMSFTDFHPVSGFSQGEYAAHLPAFLTFAACAMLLPNKWFAWAALVLLVIDYIAICAAFGYPSPGVSLAFLLALAIFFRRRLKTCP